MCVLRTRCHIELPVEMQGNLSRDALAAHLWLDKPSVTSLAQFLGRDVCFRGDKCETISYISGTNTFRVDHK